MIAALFVHADGAYNIKGVECWDQERDARKYKGPYRVIAHPPCASWGKLWYRTGRAKGDDEGCFAAAIAVVRQFGGVLEHPWKSSAFKAFGLRSPPYNGWMKVGFNDPGWVAYVEQGNYGHRARKPT